jgi:diguanylate cyclase (GGDEF)-like protein
VNEELPGRLNEVAAGVPMVVAVFDADHFKGVNDALSHEAGDSAIRELGRLLESTLTTSYAAPQASPSFVARLGGDEFLVVLPGLELTEATTVLETMRAAVEAYAWRQFIGDLRLTVSVGAVAAFATDTPSNLLTQADRNLYAAKRAGRNSVVSSLR